MPVRIYDIAKKLGLENKEVLTKAKELGITGARVPSSSLDKITAEFLENHLRTNLPEPVAPAPVVPEPIVLVTAPPEITPPVVQAPAVAAETPAAKPEVEVEPAEVTADVFNEAAAEPDRTMEEVEAKGVSEAEVETAEAMPP